MINCVWYNGSFGNWDNGLLAEIFDSRPDVFIQHNTKNNPVFERAIVCLVGKPDVKEVREYLDKIDEAFVFLLSDEDGFFRWQDAIPERHTIYTQYFTELGKSEIKNRILLGAPNRIKDYKIDTTQPKKYLWSFVGQIQNTFRQDMLDVIKNWPDGYLQICDSFGGYGNGGMDYVDYLNIMAQSRFVLSPSGSMSTDAFRTYECMEMGAIPIVNTRCQRDNEGFNYWQAVYPSNSLMQIEKWNDYHVSLYFMGVNHSAAEHNKWWFKYKQELTDKLIAIAHGS